MGSHAKNSNNQQSSTPAGPTGAGTSTPTPLGLAGPTTTAKMTPYLQKHPVGTAPISGFVPGVSDAGPKLPGMAAGFDSHGMPIPQAQPQVNPRQVLSQILTGQRGNGGSSHDRGGYTTSGSGWGGNSSANSGYGMGGRHW